VIGTRAEGCWGLPRAPIGCILGESSLVCQLGVDQEPRGFDQLALQACRAKRCGVSVGAVDQKGQSIAELARIVGADLAAEVAKPPSYFPLIAAGNRGASMLAARKFDGEIDKGTAAKLGARDLFGDSRQQRIDLCPRRTIKPANCLAPQLPETPVLLLGEGSD